MQECLYKRSVRVLLLMTVDRYVYFTALLHVPNFKWRSNSPFETREQPQNLFLFSRYFESRLRFEYLLLASRVAINYRDNEER